MSKVLIACEESQRTCIEFRNLGIEAYSCDILPCSGGFPEWHIQDDVLKIIDDSWDLIIAHPPCTYLSIAGNSWFNIPKYGHKAIDRYKERIKAIDFFMQFVYCKCRCVCIENPIGIMSSVYRKPDQIINPYLFGDSERKPTCLWLKNLPCLDFTNVVVPDIIYSKDGKKSFSKYHYDSWGLSAVDRRSIRSKTFPGIASAFANQWKYFIY